MTAQLPEQQLQHQDTLLQLQAAREFLGEQKSAQMLLETFDPEKHVDVGSTFTDLYPNGVWSDTPHMRGTTLLDCEALGVDIDELIKTTASLSEERAPLFAIQLGDGELRARRVRHGLSVRYVTDASEKPSSEQIDDMVHARLRERLAKSPAHAAFTKAANEARAASEPPEAITMGPFDPTIDPIATMAFLEVEKLLENSLSGVHQLQAGVSAEDYITTAIRELKPTDHSVPEGLTQKTITWGLGSGLRKTLTIDKESGSFTYGVATRGIEHYLERSSSSTGEKSLPFVESQCARELVDFLDAADLMLSPRMQQLVLDVGIADKFGSVYTQLSREIASWIDDPRRTRVSDLFAPKDSNFDIVKLTKQGELREAVREYESVDTEVRDAREATVRERFARAATSEDGVQDDKEVSAASQLITLTQQVIRRGSDISQVVSDLPVTRKEMKIKDGACFDVVNFYVDAANQSGLRRVKIGDTTLLRKMEGNGEQTFLSIEPMMFNGIKLPKGSLFSPDDEDGWLFQRLTPFTFDEAENQLAFGSEMSKMFAAQISRMRYIAKIGVDYLLGLRY